MITLLSGENDFALTSALRTMVHDSTVQAEVFEASDLDVGQLPDLLAGVTLFSPVRSIVIKNIDEHKQLWEELEKWIPNVSDDTTLVVTARKPDKRTRTYKALLKHATTREYGALEPSELLSWLKSEARAREVDLGDDVARYLLDYVGHDQWRLTGELEKLLLSGKPLSRALIQDIAEPYPEASTFELLDSLFRGETDKVDRLLDLLEEREDPYMFFGLLSSQVLALLAVSTGGSRRPDEVAKDFGLHPFVVRKLSAIAAKLGKSRITVVIEKLADCDVRIKTSGVEPWVQLRRTLQSIVL